MKDDHYEFTLVGIMAAFTILCVLGLGIFVALQHVSDNPVLTAITQMLEGTASGLVGALITMTRQAGQLPSPDRVVTVATTPVK